MNQITLIATQSFGLEAVVKRELHALGFETTHVADGKVEFEATPGDIPRANLWLRSADRVLLKMGEFPALTFDELFEQTKALPWEAWITEDGKFTVTGKAVRSTLGSVRACQAIVKKPSSSGSKSSTTGPGSPRPARVHHPGIDAQRRGAADHRHVRVRAEQARLPAANRSRRRSGRPWRQPSFFSASGTRTGC